MRPVTGLGCKEEATTTLAKYQDLANSLPRLVTTARISIKERRSLPRKSKQNQTKQSYTCDTFTLNLLSGVTLSFRGHPERLRVGSNRLNTSVYNYRGEDALPSMVRVEPRHVALSGTPWRRTLAPF